MKAALDVRPSPIAGTWYSGDPAALSQEIDDYLAAAHLPKLAGEVVGLIAPHAGIRYSGPVAAYSFKAVQGQSFDLVIIVAPMHQPYPGAVLTTTHQAYGTPLGTIEVDRDAVNSVSQALREKIGFDLVPVARDPEHALEIELPFLQRSLAGPFRLLPVMIRDQSPELAQALGEAFASSLKDRSVLLVASTDLSHFYPERIANFLDGVTLHQLEAFSPEGLYEKALAGEAQACGLSAVGAVLWAGKAFGADRVQILHYATSGAVTGDFSSVVGYGAAALLKTT